MSEAVAVLLGGLVDDAGLFAPTALPMRQALARHRADRTVDHPMHTGRLLCPVGALPELCSQLDDGERVDVGVVFDTEREPLGTDGVSDPRVRVTHYEIRASGPEVGKAARYLRTAASRPARRRRFLARGTGESAVRRSVYVEFDRGREGRENIARLSGVPGMGARISGGGADEEDFPSLDEVAAFIVTCADHGVPFRVAVGPHHAVRHTDPLTGFVPLGYLNLLAATAGAVAGDGPNRVARALAVTDTDRLLAQVRGIDGATAVRVRELFVGYGSCSTRDPVADAERLGLLDPALP